MSLMVGEPFFSLPQALVRGGILSRLTGSAAKVYVVLLHQAERNSDRELTLTTATLCGLAGVSPNTVRSAIKQLEAAQLIKAEMWGQQGLVVHVLSASTGQRYHADSRKLVKIEKGDASPAIVEQPLAKIDMAGSDFPFGANVPAQEDAVALVTAPHAYKLTERMSERGTQKVNGTPIYDFSFPGGKI